MKLFQNENNLNSDRGMHDRMQFMHDRTDFMFDRMRIMHDRTDFMFDRL